MAKKKPVPPGIPDSVKPVAERGERYRFNGGWLGTSATDRQIAEWIDEHPRTAWTEMKIILRLYLNGQLGVAMQSGEYEAVKPNGKQGVISQTLNEFDV